MRRDPKSPAKIHVLVDLEWSDHAGGHVKCWERFAEAAVINNEIDLTIHFSGETEKRHELSSHVALQIHKPVFSTRKIPFLGHVPDHTDMGHFHPGLAHSLMGADVIHTTDAFFCFARTAERLSRSTLTPLVHSVHTDSVAYTELFTRAMIEEKFDFFKLNRLLNDTLNVPQRVADGMQRRLDNHQRQCAAVLVSRDEDKRAAAHVVSAKKLHSLRLGMDKTVFRASKANRVKLNQHFSIHPDMLVVVFAGRLDEGKNIYLLIDAVERATREGLPIFLIAAGNGPASDAIQKRLKGYAATPGFIPPDDLAEIYASADFLALPSQVETWSMAAAEALACGLPVIAAAQSGVGRFIGDNHAGFLVHENTARAWAQALQDADKDRGNLTLRDNAIMLADSHFPSWQQALEEDLLPIWQSVRQK